MGSQAEQHTRQALSVSANKVGSGINNPCHTYTGGVSNHTGDILATPKVVAIYWGDYIGGHADVRVAFDQFFAEMLRSGFMDSLAQYGVGEATLMQSSIISGSMSPIHPSDVSSQLQSWLNNGQVASPSPLSDASNWLYVIIAPPDADVRDNGDSTTSGLCGYHSHSSFTLGSVSADIAWAIVGFGTPGASATPKDVVNSVAYCLGHEMAEAMTNPRGQGYYVDANVTANGCEIGDLCETHTEVSVGQWSVETYWSNSDSGCAAGTGTDWATFGAPPSQLLGSPLVASNADGRLEVFTVAQDGTIWHVWQTAPNNGWSNWTQFGLSYNAASSGLTAVSNTDGRIEIFFMGSGGEVWHFWQLLPNDGWSDAASLGFPAGGIIGKCTATTNSDGRIEVIGVGSDNSLWHIWQVAPNNGWSGWDSFGSPPGVPFTIGDPRVVRNEDGRLEVFILGSDGNIWHIWQVAPNNGWSGWDSFPAAPAGVANGAPFVGTNQDGRIELFVTGGDGNVYHIWQTAPSNGWSYWDVFPSPYAIQMYGLGSLGNNADGRIELFVIASDGALWHIWQVAPNNGWSNWHFLDGAPPGQSANGDQIPAVGRNADGRLEIFIVGSDKALWHIWQVASNSGWGTLVTS